MGMKAIPIAIRERIIYLYEQGHRTKEISAVLGYCAAAVRRVRQNFKRRGTLAPQTHQCGRKTLLTPALQARLQAMLDKHPDATLAELGAKFKHPTSTMDLWLARLGFSCKKNATRQRAVAARRGRPKKGLAGAAGGPARREAGVCR
jgi:transposase